MAALVQAIVAVEQEQRLAKEQPQKTHSNRHNCQRLRKRELLFFQSVKKLLKSF
jgi:hypothetical protein